MASIPSNSLTCLAFLIVSAPLAAAPQPASFMPPAIQAPQTAHVDQASTPASPAAPRVSYMYELSPEMQGDLYMARREYVAAIGAYQHAQLQKSLTWTKIGVAYHHLFAMDEAMKAYQMALRLDSHNADALNNIGAVYHAKHEYGNATKYYKKALKYNPQSAAIYCNMGTTYFAAHKYKDAEKAYGHAFAIDPSASTCTSTPQATSPTSPGTWNRPGSRPSPTYCSATSCSRSRPALVSPAPTLFLPVRSCRRGSHQLRRFAGSGLIAARAD